jgi:cobalt/nickel transport system permease protein
MARGMLPGRSASQGNQVELLSQLLKKEQRLLQIDARIKLLITLALLGMVLTYRGFFFPLLVALLCLFLCLKMKVPFRVLILRFSEPMFVALVVVFLKLLFSGGKVLFSFDLLGLKVAAYEEGLMEGLRVGCRIIGAVSLVAVMGFSTPFGDFMASLSWLKVPRSFVEILMFAYRYIFVLLEDALVIYHAQKNRLGYSNLLRGLSSFGVLAGSLTLKAFEQSQNTAVAMIQRGYDGHMPLFKHEPFKPSEIMISILFVLAMGLVWQV